MPKKKEDINDYITAHDAAQLLSQKLGRPIRADYIRKMSKSQKHCIRLVQFGNRIMYQKEDISACTILQKQPA